MKLSKKKEEKLDYEPIKVGLLPKQMEAMSFLKDQETRELVYGGGTRGGKSVLGCYWIISMCFEYPETKYLIGRSRLKILKQTTLVTFMRVCRGLGFVEGVDFKYKGDVDTLIFFECGSEVIFKDLFHYPADPDYTSLGSLEITGAFLDECGEIGHLAKTIVKTRLSWMLEEYGLMGKILMTCNPAKNWLYYDYYDPWRKGILSPDKQFLISLVDDNPFISQDYIDNLENLGNQKQTNRLRHGKWDDDSDVALFKYDVISNAFTNAFVPEGLTYMTCDAARYGNDRLVIIVWKGLKIVEVLFKEKSGLDEIVALLKLKSIQYKIPRNRIIVDADGIGGGVVDFFKGTYSFINNSRALNDENYPNLRTQCYYKLSHCMQDNQLWVATSDPVVREFITQDLSCVERIDTYNGPLKIIDKDTMKGALGRSPDFGDAMMMRMVFWEKSPIVRVRPIEIIEPDYEVDYI